MLPFLIPDDRLLVFRHWPSRYLHSGQIVVGDLRKVLMAIQNNLLISQTGNQREDIFQDVVISDSLDSDTDLQLEANLQTPSPNLEPNRIGQIKFVKRIIGLPGDTVTIHLSEINEKLQLFLSEKSDRNGNLIWHIPQGYCFVRGDGPESYDSVIW